MTVVVLRYYGQRSGYHLAVLVKKAYFVARA